MPFWDHATSGDLSQFVEHTMPKALKNDVPGKVMKIPSDMQAPWLWTNDARHSFLITATTWWATTLDGDLLCKSRFFNGKCPNASAICFVISEGLRSTACLMQVVTLLEGIVS